MSRISLMLLATYLACFMLVLSFILFEVLDIDGSDFPVTASSAEATPVHAGEHDIKRTHLVAICQQVLDLPPPSVDAVGVAVRVRRATWLVAKASGASATFASRLALARASLSDGPLPA